MTTYYDTDAADPEAPIEIRRFERVNVGIEVTYVGPVPLAGPLVVSALYRFADNHVTAILNEGEYEVDAVNLAPIERTCVECDDDFVPQSRRQIRCNHCQVVSDFG